MTPNRHAAAGCGALAVLAGQGRGRVVDYPTREAVAVEPMESGLRFRVRRASRQIAEQHRHLHELVRAVHGALSSGDRDALEALPGRLRAALGAHFSLEEEVFFPALHGLRPARREDLERLGDEHASFRGRVEELEALVRAGGLRRFERVFAELVAGLERHERLEEELVAELGSSSD